MICPIISGPGTSPETMKEGSCQKNEEVIEQVIPDVLSRREKEK